MQTQAEDLLTIGWRESVDLPEWGLAQVRAKADTGARSSALDVSEIEELPGNRVRFVILVATKKGIVDREHEAAIVRHAHVRSSQGKRARRVFVATTVRIAGRQFTTEIGLVDRSKMLCRMLIGRNTLAGHFVVDSAHTHLHGKSKKVPRLKPKPKKPKKGS